VELQELESAEIQKDADSKKGFKNLKNSIVTKKVNKEENHSHIPEGRGQNISSHKHKGILK
jgi:hypothetical protein